MRLISQVGWVLLGLWVVISPWIKQYSADRIAIMICGFYVILDQLTRRKD